MHNGLRFACDRLAVVPAFGAREIILLYCSTGTHDKDYKKCQDDLAARFRKHCIRLTVVSATPQLRLLENLTASSSSSYHVALDGDHFRALLEESVAPPVSNVARHFLVRMAFPELVCEQALPSYRCPLCGCCEAGGLPFRCELCGVYLVDGANLVESRNLLLRKEVSFVEDEVVGGAAAARKNEEAGFAQRLPCWACECALYPREQTSRVNAAFQRDLAESARFCGACGTAFCKACSGCCVSELCYCPACAVFEYKAAVDEEEEGVDGGDPLGAPALLLSPAESSSVSSGAFSSKGISSAVSSAFSSVGSTYSTVGGGFLSERDHGFLADPHKELVVVVLDLSPEEHSQGNFYNVFVALCWFANSLNQNRCQLAVLGNVAPPGENFVLHPPSEITKLRLASLRTRAIELFQQAIADATEDVIDLPTDAALGQAVLLIQRWRGAAAGAGYPAGQLFSAGDSFSKVNSSGTDQVGGTTSAAGLLGTAGAPAERTFSKSDQHEHHEQQLGRVVLLDGSVCRERYCTSYTRLMQTFGAARKAKVPIDVLQLPTTEAGAGADPARQPPERSTLLSHAAAKTGGQCISIRSWATLVPSAVFGCGSGRMGLARLEQIIGVVQRSGSSDGSSAATVAALLPSEDEPRGSSERFLGSVCMCHQRLVGWGYVCSSCLAVYCSPRGICGMCGVRFSVSRELWRGLLGQL